MITNGETLIKYLEFEFEFKFVIMANRLMALWKDVLCHILIYNLFVKVHTCTRVLGVHLLILVMHLMKLRNV